MYHHVIRGVCGGRLFGRVLRGLGSAILAGFGWKLGSDAYKSLKKEAATKEQDDAKQASEDAETA